MIKNTIVAATLFVGSINLANAELMNLNYIGGNDQQITLDTGTGIEWLKLTVTKGMSINDVQSKLGAGEQFEGWQIPTYSQVMTFVENGLPNAAYIEGGSVSLTDSNSSMSVINEVSDFAGYIGKTDYYSPQSVFKAYGYHLSEDGESAKYTRIDNYTSSTYSYKKVMRVGYGSATKNRSSTQYGVYLISYGGASLASINNPSINFDQDGNPAGEVSSVPLSGSVFSLALIMVAFRIRKKTTDL